MLRFLTFLIYIILIQKLLKNLQEQQKEQQKQPTEQEIKDYFQTLGFPPPEETPPEPEPERPKQPVIAKQEIKKPELEIVEPKSVKIEPQFQEIEESQEELLTFSTDKLEEGIILSEILGLPKAYQIRRGGGIGIRAWLKIMWG